MKKALKIIGITLASFLGLALIVVGVAMAVVSSSGQLTKMVNKYVPEFVTCEMQMDKVNLALFKTFPNVGVDIQKVTLVNPMSGATTDTLADIGSLIVVVDAKKWWNEKEIVVRKCILDHASVNLYVDSLGNSNFNVFNTKEDNDATILFDYLVNIEEVKLKNTKMFYADDRNGMAGRMEGLNLDLKGKMQDKRIDAVLAIGSDDMSLKMKTLQMASKKLNLAFEGSIEDFDLINGKLKLATPDISLNQGEPYLENDTLNLELPLQLCLSTQKVHLDSSQISLNRYLINLSGDAEIAENKDVNLDIKLNTNALVIEDAASYLPEKVQKSLSGFGYSGKMSIAEAAVTGVFNDSLMPLITAKVTTEDVMLNMPSLPHPFTEVNMDADVYLDLNSKSGNATIHGLKTKFNRSDLAADGQVVDLLGDMGLKLKVRGDMPMSDLKGFLPQEMKLSGYTHFNLITNFTLKQLTKSLKDYNLNRLSAKANIKVRNLDFDMDTLHVAAPALNAHLVLPASAKQKDCNGAYIALDASQLNAEMGKSLNAELKDSDIELIADNFKDGVEKMLLDAALTCSSLDMKYDTVNIRMDSSVISFATLPEINSEGLNARVALNGSNVVANMGKGYALNTNLLKVNASMDQDKDKTDFMNRWNPIADFVLGNAEVRLAGLDECIHISNIDILLNSDEIDFKKSTFRIGHSDISLQGHVSGVKEWMENRKNLMKGELQLMSTVLNINEILDLTSGLGVAKTSAKGSSEDAGVNPFMVPEGVDFSFALNVEKALYDNFDLNGLSGGLTVKDGTLILQEIGFTNKAAEMNLTAMYQSPRRNNLFLAMDFHLLNVQINDLLHMIPYIDTLVPMLKTFDGQAEFHIGAETYLKANYEPKISTLRASADIEGKNLSVNDKFTFTEITDKLDISTNGNYRVDSLNVQLTAFRNEIYLWPSQITMGKYKVTLSGLMTLDRNGEYHLSVTESPFPTRFGLCISGPLNNLDYKLERSMYPTLFKPNKHSDTDEMYIELKKRIADQLKENVR